MADTQTQMTYVLVASTYCPICMETIENEEVARPPCGHDLCAPCASEQYRSNSDRMTCCLCHAIIDSRGLRLLPPQNIADPAQPEFLTAERHEALFWLRSENVITDGDRELLRRAENQLERARLTAAHLRRIQGLANRIVARRALMGSIQMRKLAYCDTVVYEADMNNTIFTAAIRNGHAQLLDARCIRIYFTDFDIEKSLFAWIGREDTAADLEREWWEVFYGGLGSNQDVEDWPPIFTHNGVPIEHHKRLELADGECVRFRAG